MKCLLAFATFSLVCSVLGQKIDPQIWKNLESSATINVLVKFLRADPDSCLCQLRTLGLTNRTLLLEKMVEILKAHADSIQGTVVAAIKSIGFKPNLQWEEIWIDCKLAIFAADREVIQVLQNHTLVSYVEAEKFVSVGASKSEEVTPNATQWGVTKINAAHVWNYYNNKGAGTVVGVIDTGTLYTHEALETTYRGYRKGLLGLIDDHNYNWLDAAGITSSGTDKFTPSMKPVDEAGHGTHVTGIIAGTKYNIGVAPEAQWISCRAGRGTSFSYAALLLCGQFMICPTNTGNKCPDCSKAPHIVNNSFGADGGNDVFDGVLKAWKEAGIVSFFSSGNDGNDQCGKIGSPADREKATAVGSTNEVDHISSFTSIGPTIDGRMKPDISAPGSNITSAWPTGTSKYGKLSGTSMACPHATGTAALIVSFFIKNGLKYTVSDVIDAMKEGVEKVTPKMQTCGLVTDDVYPNNHVGSGRINAQFCVAEAVIAKYFYLT